MWSILSQMHVLLEYKGFSTKKVDDKNQTIYLFTSHQTTQVANPSAN